MHFPYEGDSRRIKTQATPSDLTTDSFYVTCDSEIKIDQTLGSEKLADIRTIVGKDKTFDCWHLDSAYKSQCSCFLTRDKTDIVSKAKALEALLGMRIFHSVDDWDSFLRYVSSNT